eukprot:7047258-Ditylum_brightwellii.AAC.1
MEDPETIQHFIHYQLNKETWSLLPDLLKPIFNNNEVDPVMRILINVGLQNTTIDDVQQRHTYIDWE